MNAKQSTRRARWAWLVIFPGFGVEECDTKADADALADQVKAEGRDAWVVNRDALPSFLLAGGTLLSMLERKTEATAVEVTYTTEARAALNRALGK